MWDLERKKENERDGLKYYENQRGEAKMAKWNWSVISDFPTTLKETVKEEQF